MRRLLHAGAVAFTITPMPEISASLDDDPTKVWSPAELLAIAFAHPPNFPPGTAYEYCNTNYALLGLMAEKIDGKPLAVVSLAYRNQDEPPRGLRSVAFRTFKDGKY